MSSQSLAHTVAVIDPHPLFRSGLETACAEDSGLRVVASVGAGRDGLLAVSATRPAVVALEVELPDIGGMAMLQALGEQSAARVVVLTGATDGASIYRALALGAAGYLTKDADPATVCEALVKAAEGDTVISPRLHRLVASEIRLHASTTAIQLTSREREVLGLVARGCSTPEIGRRLFVSHTTVKTHLANAYQKLGVSDRAAAVAQAMKRGLVEVIDEAA